MARSPSSGPLRFIVVLCLLLLLASPAGAKLFTIDGNDNDINDIDGSDDLTFSFVGSTKSGAKNSGLVSGTIRAVDLTGYSVAALEADVDTYVDFSGGATPLDFSNMDVLIFDIVLDSDSALLDEIGVAVGTNPIEDPDGAGYFDPCTTGSEPGCRDAWAGETPNGATPISLAPGIPLVFPGAALFSYDKNGGAKGGKASAGNLVGGEHTVRLFVAWEDINAQQPLSKDGMVAVFMLSSGTNASFSVAIVPEPATGLLLGVGVMLLARGRRRSS